jgi:hypothetical protein
MKKVIFVIFLIFLINCKKSEKNEKSEKKKYESVEFKKGYQTIKYESLRLKFKKDLLGISVHDSFNILRYLEGYIVWDRPNKEIYFFNHEFSYTHRVEWSEIIEKIRYLNTVSIINQQILINDPGFRKYLFLNGKGEMIDFFKITHEHFPYYANNVFNLSNNQYLISGKGLSTSIEDDTKIEYNNIFIANFIKQEILDFYSDIPNNIRQAKQDKDIIGEYVTSPFNISNYENEYYNFNMISREISCFHFKDSLRYKYTMKLPVEIFKYPMPLLREKLIKSKGTSLFHKWNASGHRISKLFINEAYIFIYIESYDLKRTRKTRKNDLIIIDKKDLLINKVIYMPTDISFKFYDAKNKELVFSKFKKNDKSDYLVELFFFDEKEII